MVALGPLSTRIYKIFPVIGVKGQIFKLWFFFVIFWKKIKIFKMFPLLYLKVEGRKIHTDDWPLTPLQKLGFKKIIQGQM